MPTRGLQFWGTTLPRPPSPNYTMDKATCLFPELVTKIVAKYIYIAPLMPKESQSALLTKIVPIIVKLKGSLLTTPDTVQLNMLLSRIQEQFFIPSSILIVKMEMCVLTRQVLKTNSTQGQVKLNITSSTTTISHR